MVTRDELIRRLEKLEGGRAFPREQLAAAFEFLKDPGNLAREPLVMAIEERFGQCELTEGQVQLLIDLSKDMFPAAAGRPFYCIRPSVPTCRECSLTSYGWDCRNNEVKP